MRLLGRPNGDNSIVPDLLLVDPGVRGGLGKACRDTGRSLARHGLDPEEVDDFGLRDDSLDTGRSFVCHGLFGGARLVSFTVPLPSRLVFDAEDLNFNGTDVPDALLLALAAPKATGRSLDRICAIVCG